MPTDWDDRNRALFAELSTGGEPSLDALVAQYLPRLRAYVHAHLPNELRPIEATEDLAQSVCRNLLAEADNFEFQGEAAFRGWLFQTTLNKLREKIRYHSRQKRDRRREIHIERTLADCLGTVSTPSRIVMADERAARLRAAIDALPADYREVVLLEYVVGLPRAAIALQLGRSEAATRMLLGRAVAKLGELLGDEP